MNDILAVLKQEAEALVDPSGLPEDFMPEDLWSAVFPTPVYFDEETEDLIPVVDSTSPAPAQTKTFNTEISNNGKLDKNYERLVRMTQVVSKFASTLTLRNIKVNLFDDKYSTTTAPAWSDSDSITFNRNSIKSLQDPAVVTALKGLSLHEICHILLTPRDGTVLVKKVRSDKLWNAFNALEDMRIEMFMTTRFSNVSEWLTATILQFLLKEKEQIKYQFPLTYGRKYLPVELRTMTRNEYVQPQHIAELEQLIDAYIVLNMSDPSKYNEAHAIIKRYDELINEINKDNPSALDGWSNIKDPNGHTHGGRKNAEWKPTNGKSMNKAQQQAISVRIKTTNGAEYGKSDEKSDEQGSTNGNGASPGGGSNERNHEVLQDLLQDIYDSKQHEIDDTIRQFNGDAALNGQVMSPPKRPERFNLEPVDPKAVSASRSFGTELAQLKADHDPAWNRRVDTGRLNVGRYVTGCDVDEAFDQWEIGRDDAVDIEAVILLDVSGSMHWCIKNAYQSMWAIKRALDKVNASTTVVTFSDNPELLYSSDERAAISMKYAGTGGGTEAKGAIKYAHSIVANSSRAIKLVITITDGEWYDNGSSDNMLRQLRKGGVLTALAYVVNPDWVSDGSTLTINSHGCEVATNITDSRDLFTLARKLVKMGVARNLS